MPIKVSCHCGQSFTAKDELVGQTLLCPKCSQPLTIAPAGSRAQQVQHHAGNAMEDLFDEIGMKEHKGPRCPRCGAPSNVGAVLCTSCGFHFQSGAKLEGAKFYKTGERGHAEATDEYLDRAVQRIAEDKIEEKKNQGQGVPWFVLLVALAMVVGFVATMMLLPRDRAFVIVGQCMVGFGALMCFYVSTVLPAVLPDHSLGEAERLFPDASGRRCGDPAGIWDDRIRAEHGGHRRER
jgi:hypothetical protein